MDLHQYDADPDPWICIRNNGSRSVIPVPALDPTMGEQFLQVLFPLLGFPSLYFCFYSNEVII